MTRMLVAGNWKMHGSCNSVDILLKAIKAEAVNVAAELVVFPPYVFLNKAAEILAGSSVAWGAQNVSQEPIGPFTGEISASMLIDFGCRYVIVGHSERRKRYGETDSQVAEKFVAALEAELCPILCVGESLEQYRAGESLSVVSAQLDAVLSLADNCVKLSEFVIAYEPVWAIGTGNQPTPEQVQEVHQLIRKHCLAISQVVGEQVRILYGGSVTPSNATHFFKMCDVDGVLVGGASLEASKFIEIGLCSN